VISRPSNSLPTVLAKSKTFTDLRIILGDQLNSQHSWFEEQNPNVLYVFMEIRTETDYVRHHAQKLIAVFSAMRNFCLELKEQGHEVFYLPIGDKRNQQDFDKNLKWIIKETGASALSYQTPDEYRLQEYFSKIAEGNCDLEIESVHEFPSEHFIAKREDIDSMVSFDSAGKLKMPTLERFYRGLRKKHNLLMQEEKPWGGRWNYDSENRSAWDKTTDIPSPFPYEYRNEELLWQEITADGVESLGESKASSFPWPRSRKESLKLLEYFIKTKLPDFGTFQDSLAQDEPFVFHSLLSFSLNTKMLSPKEVIDQVLKEFNTWNGEQQEAKISAVEGFIRQILGWREYMRLYYQLSMPQLSKANNFLHSQNLPSWYWNGETKIECLKQAISSSLNNAYAHHIQRLMITGNFALLAGVEPSQVDNWYLGIYVDAFEWVEMTNTRGMSQYADGGKVATKAYVSSARYIKKMSNHCKHCFYNPDDSTGEKACPFNALYWNFIAKHKEKLSKNPRMGMIVKSWSRFSDEKKNGLQNKAKELLNNLESL
jgi:deoxyribodipyrimidine photolyase-related protein